MDRRTWNWAGAAALALLLAAGPAPAQPAAAGPGEVVARVNGVPVTKAALARAMARLAPQGPEGAEEQRRVREEALRRLVLQELLAQRAAAAGVVPSAQEVDDALARLGGNSGTGGIPGLLAREGLGEAELRPWVARNLALERYLADEVQKKVAVTEEQVREAYAKHAAALAVPERVAVTDVIFFLDPGDPTARAKAEEVLALVRREKGGDPAALEPDGTFIVRALELRRGDDPELYAAARALEPHALSGVVTAGGSLHLLRLDAYDPPRQRSFEEARPQLEAELRRKGEGARLRELEAELRAGARIEILPEGGAGR
jgi:parvulin-like peptidyl-prolyl isomerase